MTIAIACGSGGYRTVFIHGVLSAFEEAGLRADAYAGTSASTLAAASAATATSRSVGVDYWHHGLLLKDTVENGMSDVSKITIAEKAPELIPLLFAPDAPRFFIPACAVVTEEGAEVTQSPGARKLGRKLVLSAARREPNPWVAENLELRLFDSKGEPRLTPENFEDVAYATSRMMHAWDIPATIEGKPYVDASYISSVPAVEMAERGYTDVIAISTDPPGVLYRDIFGTAQIPTQVGESRIHIILPQEDPGPMGADYTDATIEGLTAVYEMGQQQGFAFLEKW
jgi:hypothetical protein